LALPKVPDPNFEGKKVSLWFNDLCTGVFVGPRRSPDFGAALKAFARMRPDAVPYLTHQLRFGRSGHLEKALLSLRKLNLTAPLFRNIILPSSRRMYAATALREMGASAEAAVPALLDAWNHDDGPNVKTGCVAALGAIFYGTAPKDMVLGDWKVYESKVIAEASRRFPAAVSRFSVSQ
jgi:hypothetical protein